MHAAEDSGEDAACKATVAYEDMQAKAREPLKRNEIRAIVRAASRVGNASSPTE
jgi:hypothetical protein